MKTEIRDELKEIAATLANIGNENCYRVPDNYFEDFAETVMSKIQLPFTKLPFTAPSAAYFEGLAGNIINKIKSSGIIVEEDSEVVRELAAISPLIAGIEKVNVYTVPAQYFTNFKVTIPKEAQPAKIVAMRQPVRWMRYAAAAAITGMIAIGGMFLFKNNDGNTHFSFKNYTPSLSSISDNAIANYLKQSPEEMDLTPAALDDSKINAGNLAEELLNDVSDSDIQQYLQENQQIGEKDIKGI